MPSGISNITDLIQSWEEHPLISILMPLKGASPEECLDFLESARRQLYPNWELLAVSP